MTDHAGAGPHRSPAKRRAILDAAIEVFLDRGYARASVDAIAAAAGVGKQTVYGHFGGKERLFEAAVREARREPESGAGLLTDTGDPRADLTAAAERILLGALSPRVAALHRLTIAELSHHPELQRLWRDDARPPALDILAGYLRDCDRSGTLSVPDPDRAARQFGFLVVTQGRVATFHGTEPLPDEDRRRIADECADLIVRAYRPE